MSFEVSNKCFEYLAGTYKNLFSLKLHYGGRFTECPNRKYVEGEVTFVDMIDMQQFNIDLLYSVLNSSGYDCSGNLYFHYKIPLKGLDKFLKPLVNESDCEGMLEYARHMQRVTSLLHNQVNLQRHLLMLYQVKLHNQLKLQLGQELKEPNTLLAG